MAQPLKGTYFACLPKELQTEIHAINRSVHRTSEEPPLEIKVIRSFPGRNADNFYNARSFDFLVEDQQIVMADTYALRSLNLTGQTTQAIVHRFNVPHLAFAPHGPGAYLSVGSHFLYPCVEHSDHPVKSGILYHTPRGPIQSPEYACNGIRTERGVGSDRFGNVYYLVYRTEESVYPELICYPPDKKAAQIIPLTQRQPLEMVVNFHSQVFLLCQEAGTYSIWCYQAGRGTSVYSSTEVIRDLILDPETNLLYLAKQDGLHQLDLVSAKTRKIVDYSLEANHHYKFRISPDGHFFGIKQPYHTHQYELFTFR